MSGHSKWANIKHRKGRQDAIRGKIFTKHVKLIILAARDGGGDLEMNSHLRMLVAKAKKDNVPHDKIERAIKVGTGELKDEAEIKEILYEGYAPHGVALLIQALTDNNNRTLATIRTILGKNGGSLGKAGCVSYLFDRKGIFVFDNTMKDQVEEFAIENDAEDIEEDEGVIIVYTKPEDYKSFATKLHEAQENGQAELETLSLEYGFAPNSTVEISDPEVAEKLNDLVELLEEDEDINQVYTNMS